MSRLDAPVSDDWSSPSRARRTAPDRAAAIVTRPSDDLSEASLQQSPHAALLEDLRISGATRTMWFRPGDNGDVGLIAFLPGDDGVSSYRFEAIALSESDAIRDVVRQVRQWQQQQPLSPDSGH